MFGKVETMSGGHGDRLIFTSAKSVLEPENQLPPLPVFHF
jgi:hypothetical protein